MSKKNKKWSLPDESFSFDKFMSDIVEREELNREVLRQRAEGLDKTPQREYNRLYREKWQNSIRYQRKDEKK